MEKECDAMKMVREIRERHAEQLKDASPEERLEFYRREARRLQQHFQGMSTDFERDPDREF